MTHDHHCLRPLFRVGRNRRRLLLALAFTAGCLLWAGSSSAFEAVHDLTVTLYPDTGRLEGIDRLRLGAGPPERLSIGLNPRVQISALTVNGVPRRPQQTPSGLVVLLNTAERTAPLELVIRYEGLFQDDAPVRPVNTDNPGYGVSGTIGPRGTLLLGGAGWYPAVDAATENVRLRVVAPPGIIAVTAGRSLGVVSENNQTISSWQVDAQAERLALSAGRYVVTHSQAGPISIATYFLENDPQLAATYLNATANYITLYTDRFGPYPFSKFAVVENFFPTGYGFPSYTLLGGRVLRLPFIVSTSLGHEIAHCWWGNGVRVDGSDGNWSEGLTSYVAEHLYQEMDSPEAAREHRRQLLRNYTTLVAPENDFPLRRFTHRFSPQTKAVGYDKSAMVFHVLRQTIGDDAFQDGLRRLYATRLHQATGWHDLQEAFEDQSARDLDWFFAQWLDRAGAPTLWLENVKKIRVTPQRYRVEGVLRQSPPYYQLTMPLVLTSRRSQTVQDVAITGAKAPFAITVPEQPLRLEGDPHSHVLRRLDQKEIPAAINGLRRREPLLVVVPEETIPDEVRRTAETLSLGLGRSEIAVVLEKDLDLKAVKGMDLLVVGLPRQPALVKTVRAGMSLGPAGFEIMGRTYEAGKASFFGVWRHPLNEERVMAVLAYTDQTHGISVARKIPHYGRYSYLVFEAGVNRVKGVWEAAASPLRITWSADGKAF